MSAVAQAFRGLLKLEAERAARREQERKEERHEMFHRTWGFEISFP